MDQNFAKKGPIFKIIYTFQNLHANTTSFPLDEKLSKVCEIGFRRIWLLCQERIFDLLCTAAGPPPHPSM